jgi:hypothetical protein
VGGGAVDNVEELYLVVQLHKVNLPLALSSALF